MSLRLRLSLTLLLVFVLIVGVALSYLVFNVRQAIAEELQASLGVSARLVAMLIQYVPDDQYENVTRELTERLVEGKHRQNSSIAITTDQNFSAIQGLQPSPDGVPDWFVKLVQPEPLQLVRAIALAGGTKQLVIYANASEEISESWNEVRPVMLLVVAYAAIGIVLVYVVLGRSLRSLNSLSMALEAVEAGRYDRHVDRIGVKDVDEIADRFNHMADVLQKTDRESQQLAQRSLAIQEDERRRLAQEMHDELGQSISAIKALAVSIREQSSVNAANGESGPASAIVGSADMIAQVSSDIYDDVRRMMAQLRPVVLDELGLIPALQLMIDEWNQHHEDTFVEFEARVDVPRLAANTEINFYRIVQEALTNIAKHADASRARVVIESSPEGREYVVTIEDDGAGFDPNTVPRGLGLVGIEERAEVVGGAVDVSSSPGQGTRLLIRVPSSEVSVHV